MLPKTDPKFGLSPDKPDPMDLRSQRESIAVPAGCAIFWSPYLLHGTEKSATSSGVTFGMYLGFITDIDRSDYEDGQERQDRRDSFMHGRAPRMFPSLDTVHYCPHRYVNFQRLMQACVDRTPAGYAGRGTRTTARGGVVDILEPVMDPTYVPHGLTVLGRRLLGMEPWV